MELDRVERGHQSDSLRTSQVFAAPTGPMPERLQRRVVPSGSTPPFEPLASTYALPSSELAIQLFAEAVSAGVHPAEHVQRAAAHGLSGSSSSLPHLAAIQHAFGRHDVSGVQAHVGGAAAEGAAAMGAHGYAAGNSVAFAAAPDLHLAAHEAAHVIQQRAGVHLKGGIGEVGDAYERHADAVADLVVQGKSAESLLDAMAPANSNTAASGVQRFAVQMNPHAAHGTGAGAAAAAPVTAPSDPPTLLRYARDVHGHLREHPNQLVPYARALDRQLLAGGFTEARDIQTVVSALQAIRGALASRPPGDLAAFRTAGSPGDGMLEDIAPFGNVDLWIAAQSAARDRQRQQPHPHPQVHPTGGDGDGGGPGPLPADEPGRVDPAYTAAAAAVEGHETGGALARATRPADQTDAQTASLIDNASSGYDYASELGLGFGEFVGEVVMPIVQPMLMLASLALTMDQALEDTRHALRGFGIRMSVHELSLMAAPYPATLLASALMQRIKTTDELYQERATAAGHFESEGDIVALISQGAAQVAAGVNGAVARAEQWPGVGQALQRHPEAAAQIHQDIRRHVYSAMVERMQAETSQLH